MKAITLLALAALNFAGATSQAEILVYKGVTRTTGDISNPLPPACTFFQIVDTTNSTLAGVSLVNLGGKRVQLVSAPFVFNFAQAQLQGGKSATTISLGLISGSGNTNFDNLLLHFRGVNTSLKVTSDFGGTFKTFPRVLTGVGIQDKAFASQGSFTENRTVVSYQQARSIAANEAKQTAQQVLDALSAEMKGKGFQVP